MKHKLNKTLLNFLEDVAATFNSSTIEILKLEFANKVNYFNEELEISEDKDDIHFFILQRNYYLKLLVNLEKLELDYN